jgi:dephospho-CoA kinase
MREIVFGDPEKKRQLEAILHPLIGTETERQAGAARAAAVVFDVPLLVESSRWRARVDKVLVVDCDERTQVERVVARSGWTPDAVRAVIAQQAPRTLRRACADAVIFNDGIDLAALERHVLALWERWTRPPR